MRVELRNISKHFGRVQANRDISLTIEPSSIHGLVGENGAGKTTLMRILAGYMEKDAGEILINGETAVFSSPREAAVRGIGMLHQDTMDVPVFSALENFMLGQACGLRQKKPYYIRKFRDMAADMGFFIHPDEPTATMTPGARQQLDIIRLLSAGTRLLILDEPTAGLSDDQKTVLFESLRRFAGRKGNCVVLVSHKIADIELLCDHMTVLRKGCVSGSLTPPFESGRVLHLMFGPHRVPVRRRSAPTGNMVFSTVGISAAGGRFGLYDCNFSVRRGEVVGLAGLEGSGQELFLKTAAGLTIPQSGTMTLEEEDITIAGYHALRKKGVGYIPADRLGEGLVPDLTVGDHFLVAENAPFWARSPAKGLLRANDAIFRFQIKGDTGTPARSLSGGNQQRLLLALIPETASLLFLDKPTRGLDPESAGLLWSRLHTFSDRGGTVVFSSSDLDELLTMSDRIVVFFNGRPVANLPAGETSIERLEKAITGNDTATRGM